jgi:nitrogenase subunit NifH
MLPQCGTCSLGLWHPGDGSGCGGVVNRVRMCAWTDVGDVDVCCWDRFGCVVKGGHGSAVKSKSASQH